MKGGKFDLICSAVFFAISMAGCRLSFARERQTALEKSPNCCFGGTLKGTSSTFKSSFNNVATPSLIILLLSLYFVQLL
jgi:hypothetical protein